MHEAERQVIGASHAQIGAYLLGIWRLPYPVVEADYLESLSPPFSWAEVTGRATACLVSGQPEP